MRSRDSGPAMVLQARPVTAPAPTADIILAGGGLASGLLALRLKRARPDLRVAIVERAASIGEGHTWSAFESDIQPSARAWVEPLFAHRWDSYDVRFPAHARTLSTPYATMTADRLHAAVTQAVGEGVMLHAEAAELTPAGVVLRDGRALSAPAVVDARGPEGRGGALKLGFQKFVGLEVETAEPHGVSRPVIMDADLPQTDGYRFLYLLPFSPTRLLVEDTRYADGAALDLDTVAAEARAYAQAKGWRIVQEVRREHGVLPVALAGDIEAFWRAASADGVARAGLRAALFHPTTGYSLPDAVRLAERVGAHLEAGGALTTAALAGLSRTLSTELWEARGFYRLLNRMLFRAAEPGERYRVLQRFYRLPEPLIRRFYAGEATAMDKLRVLTGRPPVPVGRAVGCLSEQRLMEEAA